MSVNFVPACTYDSYKKVKIIKKNHDILRRKFSLTSLLENVEYFNKKN